VTVDARTIHEERTTAALLGLGPASPGLLEQARGGTLLLSDIEDLPAGAQRLLSGILESDPSRRGAMVGQCRCKLESSPRRGRA